MKKVYVDASDRHRLITIVFEGEKKVYSDSTFTEGKFNVQPHEAEYLAILSALKISKEDLEIASDNESVVDVLNGKSRRRKAIEPYVYKIRELCQNRIVKFTHKKKESNPASLFQMGYSLYEIHNPKLMEAAMKMKQEYIERRKKMEATLRKTKRRNES